MLADADLASLGRTLGDTHRARFVLALLGGQELTAGELASRAGASSSLASAHLAKLLESGLITVRKRGRQRYYRLASRDIAQAIEALLAIAPQQTATGLTGVSRGKALQRARTCYDHVAGRLGAFGLDVDALHGGRRPLLRPCLDWTERRPHMAGQLGQALAGRLLDLGWVRRGAASRALVITPLGEQQLLAEFAIKV
jgi:DNA-binding transcriptional ArsR family regulator